MGNNAQRKAGAMSNNPFSSFSGIQLSRQWTWDEMQSAVPWTDDIKWQPVMVIKADTYKVESLFHIEPVNTGIIDSTPEENRVYSPNKTWAYVEKILPRGYPLDTYKGTQKGIVVFDGPVKIPAIHKKCWNNSWDPDPMMSLTPMEILTLRSGLRFAKGHVIVAGLGMGHLLMRVMQKKTVQKVTLVEVSQDLVDWVMPRLNLGAKPIEVVVGNAYEVMPKMEADIALMDIFPSYGGNGDRCEVLVSKAEGIKRWWIWGSQPIGGSLWDR